MNFCEKIFSWKNYESVKEALQRRVGYMGLVGRENDEKQKKEKNGKKLYHLNISSVKSLT